MLIYEIQFNIFKAPPTLFLNALLTSARREIKVKFKNLILL